MSVKDVFGAEFFKEELESAVTSCLEGRIVHLQIKPQPSPILDRYLNITLSPYHSDRGDINGYVFDIRDVTPQVELQNRLKNAQKMEAIGLLAGGVAHDLNNILSGVISFPEFMMMNLPEGDPVRADLQKVMESGQRAAGVVADLLTVARGAAIVKEPICLNELIGDYMVSPEVCNLISLYPEVNFVTRLTPEVKHILCSPVHIQKVLLNLFTNAAESINGAGEVEVCTFCRTIDHVDAVQGMSAGEYTVLRVQDTGTGISQHDLDHIFDPFYSTKKMGRSGTGLGLAVVWNTVQDHEGSVSVNSGDGGTAFTLHLPVSKQAKSSKMSKLGEVLGTLHGKETLLVVDDEEMQREIVVKILTTLGYEVSAVSSGEEALVFLEKNTVDLVLLDMHMEPGINGRQTFEQIIRIHPEQKAIVVSGYSESDDIKHVMALGGCGLLKKPYTMEEIGRAVQEALQ